MEVQPTVGEIGIAQTAHIHAMCAVLFCIKILDNLYTYAIIVITADKMAEERNTIVTTQLYGPPTVDMVGKRAVLAKSTIVDELDDVLQHPYQEETYHYGTIEMIGDVVAFVGDKHPVWYLDESQNLALIKSHIIVIWSDSSVVLDGKTIVPGTGEQVYYQNGKTLVSAFIVSALKSDGYRISKVV